MKSGLHGDVMKLLDQYLGQNHIVEQKSVSDEIKAEMDCYHACCLECCWDNACCRCCYHIT